MPMWLCTTSYPTPHATPSLKFKPTKETHISDLTDAKIIEIAKFRINDGASYDQFAPLDRAVEDQHVSKQPGFVARYATMDKNGVWLVAVYWASTEAAGASMASFMDAPAAADFVAHFDGNTMTMTRLEIA